MVMNPDPNPLRAEPAPYPERMTSRERSELAALIRRRERVAKTTVGSVKAERLAQLEVDLAASFAAEDERFRDLTRFAARVIERANAEVQSRCEEMGIPEHFRPHLEVRWSGRGENATAARRAELRRVGQARADADAKAAQVELERASVDLQTELVRDGLTTTAAERFLERLPTPEQLLPQLNVPSLLRELPGHHDDKTMRDLYGYDYRRHQLDAAALDELLGQVTANGRLLLATEGRTDDDDQS